MKLQYHYHNVKVHKYRPHHLKRYLLFNTNVCRVVEKKHVIYSKKSNTMQMFVLQVFKISISLSQADRNINNIKRLLTRFEGILSSVWPEKNFQSWNTMFFFNWIKVISSHADIFTLWQNQNVVKITSASCFAWSA